VGIFDSIKNAFGGKEEAAADQTVSPSQMLRDAGIDTEGLRFGFGAGSITVSGDIADESDRQKILDVLAGAPGITRVQDNMVLAASAPAEPVGAPSAAGSVEEASGGAEAEAAAPGENSEQRTYTVQSGDTLWKIAEQMYGNGSKYMKIFEANSDLLEHPDQIFPGQKLVIPDL